MKSILDIACFMNSTQEETRKMQSKLKSFLALNSRKYGLGSLRKTPHRGHLPHRLGAQMWTVGLTPTTLVQPIF